MKRGESDGWIWCVVRSNDNHTQRPGTSNFGISLLSVKQPSDPTTCSLQPVQLQLGYDDFYDICNSKTIVES